MRIIPLPGQRLSEQLNAAMRFALYYGVVLLVLRRSWSGLYVPLLAAAITFVIYSVEERQDARITETMDRLSVEVDPVSRDLRSSPTCKNPFMNVLVTDYADFPSRPRAADIQDPRVLARAEHKFDNNLFHDQSDVFDRITNSHQFYTMPSTTIPNQQTEFANWLYKTGPTCKEGLGSTCNALAFRPYPDM